MAILLAVNAVVGVVFGIVPVAGIVVAIALWPMVSRSGAELAGDRILLHRGGVSDFVRWSSITGIEEHRTWFRRRVRVRHRFGSDLLPAPYDGRLFGNPAFDAELEEILAAWRRATG